MRLVTALACAVLAAVVLDAQRPVQRSPYLAVPDQVLAVRAGRLFDAKNGTLRTNQIVLVQGDRITDVGPGVAIPPGARVLDLSAATVLPGMIDAHVHNAGRVEAPDAKTIEMVQSAQRDLDAGSPRPSTWIRAAGSAPSISATRSRKARSAVRACRWPDNR